MWQPFPTKIESSPLPPTFPPASGSFLLPLPLGDLTVRRLWSATRSPGLGRATREASETYPSLPSLTNSCFARPQLPRGHLFSAWLSWTTRESRKWLHNRIFFEDREVTLQRTGFANGGICKKTEGHVVSLALRFNTRRTWCFATIISCYCLATYRGLSRLMS